jgi:hypothetical protein
VSNQVSTSGPSTIASLSASSVTSELPSAGIGLDTSMTTSTPSSASARPHPEICTPENAVQTSSRRALE